MNSNQKHHEQEETESELKKKIAYQIKNYSMRKIVAQDEIANLHRCFNDLNDNLELFQIRQDRNAFLKQEINFCNGQIKAYKENDNKNKIIPDRLL